jgi:methyl-accepting chemotaxis protein
LNFLDNYTVKSRLIASFGLVLGFMTILIGLNLIAGRSTVTNVTGIVESEIVKFELTAAIDSATKNNARNTLEMFITQPEQRPEVRKRIGAARANIDGLFAKLGPMLETPKEKALFTDIQEKRKAFVKAFTTATDALTAGEEAQALGLVRESVLPAIDALKVPIDGLLALQKELAVSRADAIVQATNHQSVIAMILGTVSVLVGLASAWLLIGSIMQPLKTANYVASEIAQGNLAVQFDARGKNELSQMLISLNQMKEYLAHVMMRIQQSTAEVASASREIAAANMDLSSRTESQASSLEQTAAAMEQMTSTTAQNSSTTVNASQLANEVSVATTEVGALVASVASTMGDIYTSSKRINDIIGTIDSIAFQTNILALNAAVEAARAGEQGRGFAVVASEVRLLAQRSALAAHEIKTIIQDNAQKMDLGNKMAQRAGEAVSGVVGAIQEVKASVAEVAHATQEQTIGIQQVGQAVSHLDEATQQNAALVEQTAAAAQNLDAQVQALQTAINRFQIGPKTSPQFRQLSDSGTR